MQSSPCSPFPSISSTAADNIHTHTSIRHSDMNTDATLRNGNGHTTGDAKDEDRHQSRRPSTTKSVRSTRTLNTGHYNKQPAWRTGMLGASSSSAVAPPSISVSASSGGPIGTSPPPPPIPTSASTSAVDSNSSTSTKSVQSQPLEASVSFVLAEREHGAPLASAREGSRHRLLSLSATATASTSSALTGGTGSAGTLPRRRSVLRLGIDGNERDRGGLSPVAEPDVNAAAQEADASELVGIMPQVSTFTAEDATETHPKHSAISSIDSEATTETIKPETVPIPESEQHQPLPPHPDAPPSLPTTPSKKLNTRSSWFSSLTRSKGKEKEREKDSATLSTPAPATSAAAEPLEVKVDPPTPDVQQDAVFPGHPSDSSSSHSSEPQSQPQLRSQAPALVPAPAQPIAFPASTSASLRPTYNAELASGSAPVSVSLPSTPTASPLRHHPHRKHLFDAPSPSGSTTSLPATLRPTSSPSSPTPSPPPSLSLSSKDPISQGSSTSTSSNRPKSKTKTSSKSKNGSGARKRSWFYSSPPTPVPSPPRSEPSTPPPGYVALPAEGEGEREDVQREGADSVEGDGGAEGDGNGVGGLGLELGEKDAVSFEGWMKGRTEPVHAGLSPQLQPQLQPDALQPAESTSSTDTAHPPPGALHDEPATNTLSAESASASSSSTLTSTSTSTPGPRTPSSPSPTSAQHDGSKTRPKEHRSTPSLPSSIDDCVPSLPHTPPAGTGAGAGGPFGFGFTPLVVGAAGAAGVVGVVGGISTSVLVSGSPAKGKGENQNQGQGQGQKARSILGVPLSMTLPLSMSMSVPLLGRPKAAVPSGSGSAADAGGGAEDGDGAVASVVSVSVQDGDQKAGGGAANGAGGGAESAEQLEDVHVHGASGEQNEPGVAEAGVESSETTTAIAASASPDSGGGELASAEVRKDGSGAEVKGASWWDYVGWKTSVESEKGGPGAADDAPLLEGGGDSASEQVAVAAAVSEVAEDTAKDEVDPAEIAAKIVAEVAEEAQEKEEDAQTSESGQEVVGSSEEKKDAESNITSAAWLARWSWYYASSSSASTRSLGGTTSAPPAVAEERAEDVAPQERSEEEEEEKVSVVQEDVTEEVGGPRIEGDQTQEASVVPYTPIQAPSSSDDQASDSSRINSSWASSFLNFGTSGTTASSRLLVRTLAAYAGTRSGPRTGSPADGAGGGRAIEGGDVTRDENGMEVMNLDFDDFDDEEERGRKPFNSAESVSTEIQRNVHAASRSRSRLSTKDRGAPLLIVSDDLKRESARIFASKSNSKVASGTSTPLRSGTTTPVARSPASPSSMRSGAGGPNPAGPVDESKSGSNGHVNASVVTTSAATTTTSSTTKTTTTMSNGNAKTATAASDTTKRAASPAPSSKSTTSSTASGTAAASSTAATTPTSTKAPPPPNLVLPTWHDTFHAPPRSVLPPRPRPRLQPRSSSSSSAAQPQEEEQGVGKLIGRTMKFVSGVLFAGSGSGSGGAGTGAGSNHVVVPSPLGRTAVSGKAVKGKQRARMRSNSTASDSSEDKQGLFDDETLISDASAGANAHPAQSPQESALERYRRARMRAFGMELPKAWRVYEEAGWDVGFAGAEVDEDRRSVHSASSLPTMARARSASASGPRTAPMRRSSTSQSRKARKDNTTPAVDTINDTHPSFEADGAASPADADDGDRCFEGMPGMYGVLRGCKRVVVIGVHGWFPGAMIRSMLGEPTGTSQKFTTMTAQALRSFEAAHGVRFEKVTQIPLEGEGIVERRVERLYTALLASPEHLADVHAADAVLVAAHSQGSVVAAHLLARLYADGHLVSARSREEGKQDESEVALEGVGAVGAGAAAPGPGPGPAGTTPTAMKRGRKAQRVCLLALCGIHLGPLRYLSSSTLVGPYLQYFESTAARELFEFQNTESAVSKAYVAALTSVLAHGTKVVYIASLNDQVVPIYSGLFTAANHPLILRALYIDGDAYHSSDFLSALLVLLLRIRNAGLPDSGLLAHLSEATAGSLSGVGHSTAYEEEACYRLAVDYLFLADDGLYAPSVISSNAGSAAATPPAHAPLLVDTFNALHEQNDYEIPWALRDIIADERIAFLFAHEFVSLKRAFGEWHPKTSILRELKRKLQPITRLGVSVGGLGGGLGGGGGLGMVGGVSKL